MVREIIHVQVGQCGNQVGTRFWHAITLEHKLDNSGKWSGPANYVDADGDGIPDEIENVDVFFRAGGTKGATWQNVKRTPRAIIVDLEPGTGESIAKSDFGTIFDPTNMINGENGAGNNWAKGHYTEGAEKVESVMDVLRKESEKAECVQGFQLFHSLGGGTGSGMGTLLLLKIRDSYPDKITCTYSVFPSPKVSDTVVEPYNAVLSSHQLLENSDETFVIDNEALYNIMHNVIRLPKAQNVDYKTLNNLISKVCCGVTASIRFPGMLNGDLRKLGVNLVPFPRLHFFLCAYAPLESQENAGKVAYSVKELTTQATSARNFYANVKADDGKYLAMSLMYRGKPPSSPENAKKEGKISISSKDVDFQVSEVQKKNTDSFVEWIPNNIKSGIVKTAPYYCAPTEGKAGEGSQTDCTKLSNTTGLKAIFQRLATQFGQMYRRKAFLHWYKGEGMDEMEFQEADKNVRDLITEYQDKQDAQLELDESEEDMDAGSDD